MAKQFSFTDASGVTHANAYARVTRINIDLDSNTAEFRFSIYADADKRQPPAKRPVGWIDHTVKGEEFLAEYAAHLGPDKKTLGAIAYSTATTADLFPVEAIDV